MPTIYLDDFQAGQVRECGRHLVTTEEIVEFATRYDPQPFHTDEAAAQASPYGGLIASGWMTCALAMRMVCDGYLLDAASLGSPGVDQVRWLRPVRPGDVLRMRVTIRDVRVSQSKPDRGIVRTGWEMFNQNDELVLTTEGTGIFRRRPAAAGA
ncbi:MAG: MaoC family dehydratase [Burkholderiales bacterium]|nr:MaoC family dehydratase [Burkholderiales bacterium]